ncbi:cytosolic carboxypeptidase-like protein 5 [Octopus sinensis]|uniref:Cytosolic carboxypeptidase-like protein 5 n=1 Tax=Octopus sinensis TaxID=2607531 RepID=A0A6P7U0J7_9MOLL|nr:cytosolic carboxypeptidase-like protein 5 [Octopus sinensis]
MNMQNQKKLFQLGHVPMVRNLPCKSTWERIQSNVDFEPSKEGFSLYFTYTFPEEFSSSTEFAFTYPWTYEDDQTFFARLQELYSKHPSIYFHREVLCYSLGGNNVDLITISGQNGFKKEKEKRFNCRIFDNKIPRCAAFNKKVILLSARVHPGETPGSLVLLGLVRFLLSNDKNAARLRKEFVFKIVPMLNPDGILVGNYRMDCLGSNLNRVYNNPDPLIHPSIYSVKSLAIYHHIANSSLSKLSVSKLLNKVFPQYQDDNEMDEFLQSSDDLNHPELLTISSNESGIAFYIDFHGHVSKRGCFLYGNYFKDEKTQVLKYYSNYRLITCCWQNLYQ